MMALRGPAVFLGICLVIKGIRAKPTDPALADDKIADINRKNLGWTAGRNPRFEGLNRQHLRDLLGVKFPEGAKDCPPPTDGPASDLPDSFDARTKWPNYIHPIRNQGQCGSCWAFAATEILSDRLAIASKGAYNKVLSPQALVRCDVADGGCWGGFPANAANFLEQNGAPEEGCEPYEIHCIHCEPVHCPTRCLDGSYRQLYKWQSWNYTIGENAMKAALQSGPVAVSMIVYDGFQYYKSGVYSSDGGGEQEGIHAIKLVGYGTTGPDDKPPSTPYWLVANSWGTDWGENGYFRIKRGDDNCGIEQGVSRKGCPLAGIPLVPTPSPVPPPAPPASYHYGEPPCRSDEVLTINDVGSMCTSPCGQNGDCPTDVPPGTKARPQCTKQFNKTHPVCALYCEFYGVQCPKGTFCHPSSPLPSGGGFCTWEMKQQIVV